MTQFGPEPTVSVALEPNTPLPLLVSTVNVLVLRFAQIKSTLPSRLTSAATTERGPLPTVSVALEPKLPPLLVSTMRVLLPELAQIKSTLPSRLTSAAATETVLEPVASVTGANPFKALVPPVCVSTVSVLVLKELAQIKSILPSPFKSAAATNFGPLPVSSDTLVVKPPLPLLVNTVNVSFW